MSYTQHEVMQAFSLYTTLARDSKVGEEAVQLYTSNDQIRSLLHQFAKEVDCVIVRTSNELFLIPETRLGPFHVSNDWIKRNYLRSDSVNADIYLLYFCIIVEFSSFHDYEKSRPCPCCGMYSCLKALTRNTIICSGSY